MRRPGKTALHIALVVGGLLLLSLLAALSYGLIPKTLGQVLLVVFVVGPLLLLAEPILEFLMQVIAYGIGRIVLPVISLGRARGEEIGEQLSFPWYGIARLPTGVVVLSCDATSLFGLALAAFGVAAAFVIYW